MLSPTQVARTNPSSPTLCREDTTSPGAPTAEETSDTGRQGPGGGFEVHYTAKVRKHPTPQEPGTQHFFLDEDNVPELPGTNDAPRGQTTARETEEPELFTLFEEKLGGTRPDRLSDVRPQERVPRRTVEQIVDSVPVVPLLHTFVLQMVDSVVEVLKILGNSLPDVGGTVGGCASPGVDRAGTQTWLASNGARSLRMGAVGRSSGGWWAHAIPRRVSQTVTPPAPGGILSLGPVVDVVLVVQRQFQQSFFEMTVGWCLRVSSSTECRTFQKQARWVRTVQNCAKHRRTSTGWLVVVVPEIRSDKFQQFSD